MSTRNALGSWGEDLAVRHLESRGLEVIDRRWRCRLGEIDIVARDGGILVVCEVKTRTTEMFGTPLAAVTPRKVRRLRQLAVTWLREHDEHVSEIRLDVIGILAPDSASPVIEHLRGVA